MWTLKPTFSGMASAHSVNTRPSWLAGDFGLAILEQLYVMVEDDGHSSADAAVALWQCGLGFLGNLLYGFTPGSSSRVLTGVVRPGVAFPVILCYDCHGSIPRMRGLG